MPERHAFDSEVAHPFVHLLLRRLKPGAATPRVLVLGAGSGRNLPPLLAAGAAVDVVEPAEPRRTALAARFADAAARARARDESAQAAPVLPAPMLPAPVAPAAALPAPVLPAPALPAPESGALRIVAALGELEGSARYGALLSTHALLHGTPAEAGALLRDAVARLEPGGGLYATFGSRGDPRFGTGTRIDDATWAPAGGSEAGVPHAYFSRETLLEFLSGLEIDDLTEASARDSAGAWAHDAAEAATMRHWFAIAHTPGGGS